MWTWNRSVALAWTVGVSLGTHGAEGVPPVELGKDVLIATPAKDDINYEGDRIWFPTERKVWRRDLDGNLTAACIRPGQPLIGRRKATRVDKSEGKDESISGWLLEAVESRTSRAHGECPGAWAKEDKQVKVGQSVFIPDTEMQASDRARVGWTYGALVVPYKYQMGGDKEFSPSASLGGYLGWRFEQMQPVSMKVVTFAGASMVPIAVRDGQGKPTDKISNHAAFSWGIGFLGTLKSSFQFGVVVGVDHVGKSVEYANQDKPWVALSLGYDFAN